MFQVHWCAILCCHISAEGGMLDLKYSAILRGICLYFSFPRLCDICDLADVYINECGSFDETLISVCS